MNYNSIGSRGRKTAIVGAVLVLLLAVLAAALWVWRADRAREAAELQLGLDSSRIVAQAFTATNQLRVSQLRGQISTKTSDPGAVAVLSSSQRTSAPFTVDYFVDLSRVKSGNFAWNAEKKVLAIEVADPVPAPPNVDEGAASVTQEGLFISRGAAVRLAQKSSANITAKAAAEARKPENMAKAREAARQALRANALAPLKAAGIAIADVRVTFTSEARSNDDVWDYTTRLEDVRARIEELNGR